MAAPGCNRLPIRGELVVRRSALSKTTLLPDYVGLFMGRRTFKTAGRCDVPYVCSEVWWFGRPAPNGDTVSTIQCDLIARHPLYETLENNQTPVEEPNG